MNKLRAGIYVFCLILFGLLSYFAHKFSYFPGDVTFSLWLKGIDLSFIDATMRAVSNLGDTITATVTVILVASMLWFLRKRLEMAFIVLLPSLAALLTWLLKILINRPRPGSELMEILSENNGLSFPSGHVTYAVVFFGFLFYLVPRLVKQPAVAWTLRSLLILLIFLMATSRVYLQAHWPSDILGSFLLGGLLLALAINLYQNRTTGHQRTSGDKNA